MQQSTKDTCKMKRSETRADVFHFEGVPFMVSPIPATLFYSKQLPCLRKRGCIFNIPKHLNSVLSLRKVLDSWLLQTWVSFAVL